MSSPTQLIITRQRRAILEELDKLTSHPTADEVFRMVRTRLPHISLGTVYRNLEILSDAGLIRRLRTAGEPMRFDANVANHSHIRCLGCGRVDDAEVEPAECFRVSPDAAPGYEITGFVIELMGYCAECRMGSAKD